MEQQPQSQSMSTFDQQTLANNNNTSSPIKQSHRLISKAPNSTTMQSLSSTNQISLNSAVDLISGNSTAPSSNNQQGLGTFKSTLQYRQTNATVSSSTNNYNNNNNNNIANSNRNQHENAKSNNFQSHHHCATEPSLPSPQPPLMPSFQATQLTCKPKMQSLVSHRGDSQISMHEESFIQQPTSFLIESDQIRERNQHSVGKYSDPDRKYYIKKLRDLQEPRVDEEEDSDSSDDEIDINGHYSDIDDVPNDIDEDSSSLLPPPPLLGQKVLHSPRDEFDIQEELAILNQVHIVTRQHGISTSQASSYNTRIRNNSLADKQRKLSSNYTDLRNSQTSTEGRTLRVSTSETLASINHRQTFALVTMTTADKSPPLTPVYHSASPKEEEDEGQLLMQMSEMTGSSASVLIVPDEPEKCLLNESLCFSAREGCRQMKSRVGIQKSSYPQPYSQLGLSVLESSLAASVKPPSQLKQQPTQHLSQQQQLAQQQQLQQLQKQQQEQQDQEKFMELVEQSIREQYFVPQLLRCFMGGKKDKQQLLYQYHFMKTFQNYVFAIKTLVEITAKKEMHSIYLPPLKDKTKKTIFFDLDDTLIHCITTLDIVDAANPQSPDQLALTFLPKLRRDASKQSQNESKFPSRNSDSCNEVVCYIYYDNKHIQCVVSIRPYAIEMLRELAKDFELILWTAGQQVYADAILEKLDPHGDLFSHRFYRDKCTEVRYERTKLDQNAYPAPHTTQQQHDQFQSHQQKQHMTKTYVKDLRIFSNRKLENIVLVDNQPLTFLKNLDNGIPIIDYSNDNSKDNELVHLTSFLKSIKDVPDVRQVIRKKFKLRMYKDFSNIEDLQRCITAQYLQAM